MSTPMYTPQVVHPSDPDFWNPYWYCQMTRVKSRRAATVPFILWAQQIILANAIQRAYHERKNVIAVKPRRGGFTNLAAVIAGQHASFREGVHAAIISNKRENVTVAIDAARLAWRHLPPEIRPPMDPKLKRSLEFTTYDPLGNPIEGRFTGHSAKDEDPLRGDGVHCLIADELSSWGLASQEDVWTAARSAVPEDEGIIIGVSTPKYDGDPAHLVWQEADSPGSRWIKVFIPWTGIPEYQAAPHPGWHPNDVVAEYAAKWRISADHAYWMQTYGLPKCANSLSKFRAEYPISDYDAWMMRADGTFNAQRLNDALIQRGLTTAQPETEEVILLVPPLVGHRYVITLDPAGSWAGVDYFGAVCVDIDTLEDVWEFRGHMPAYRIGDMLNELAETYNGAAIYIEANGVGEAVLAWLEGNGCRYLYYREDNKPGWWSSAVNKSQAIGRLQQLVDDGSYTPGTVRGIRQLLGYNGGWVARDAEGGHWDLTAARAIAAWAWFEEGGRGRVHAPRDERAQVDRAIHRMLNGPSFRYGAGMTSWGTHR